MSPDMIRDWCDAIRIEVRSAGGLTDHTYAAGMRVGMLQAVRQLELLLDRLEAGEQSSAALWQVTKWGSTTDIDPVWTPEPLERLVWQVRECTLEVLDVDPVAPNLIRVEAIDARDGEMYRIEILLEAIA